MEPAPFFAAEADGPDGGHAVWLHAEDDTRLRLALWPKGARGTVILFPGRTEYAEKYGRAAADLAARGYAMTAVDWRGQGLADRPLDDRNTGHVRRFGDYQCDVAAQLAAIRAADLPAPYYLIAHSMGGTIGLRALIEGLPVAAAVFSAPMWGIRLARLTRPVAWALSHLGRACGCGHRYAPGSGPGTYVDAAPFVGNLLTSDAEMYAYMQAQTSAHPELALGGPSLNWLAEALGECRRMARIATPALPCVTFLGGNERIVDPAAIHRRMAAWPQGRLELVAGAEHEIMMEGPATRARFFDAAAALFDAHRGTSPG